MADRTKLVVRHLPAGLPEPVFWTSVAPWVDQAPLGSILYKCFVPGKVRHNKNKENTDSRAYIQFATVEQVVEFHKGYDEHVFRDSKGNVSTARVEFAPYQKTSGPSKREDPRQGTIEEDGDYKAFLESLNAKEAPETTATVPPKVEPPTSTPLIDHLRAQRKAAETAKANAKAAARAAKANTALGAKLPPGAQPQIVPRGVAVPAAAPSPLPAKTKPPKKVAAKALKVAAHPGPKTSPANAIKSHKSAELGLVPLSQSSPTSSPATLPSAATVTSSLASQTGDAGRGRCGTPGRGRGANANRGGRGGLSGRGVGRGGRGGSTPQAQSPQRHPAALSHSSASPAPSAPAPSPAVPAHAQSADGAPPAKAVRSRPRRGGGVADDAGARRRLGNALAGIGSAAERRRRPESKHQGVGTVAAILPQSGAN